MTDQKALKRAVRARMARTGENYTTARRAVTGQNGGGQRSPLAGLLAPGRSVLVVCGGGMLNTAFALPEVVRLAEAGHPLVVVADPRRKIEALASPVDVLIHHGSIDVDQAARLVLEDERATLRSMVESLDIDLSMAPAYSTEEAWVRRLEELAARAGVAPVVWVQDVQVAGALDVEVGGEEKSAVQVRALTRLAARTGAIVAAGHCMPADFEEGWQGEVAEASAAVVIETDPLVDASDEIRDCVLLIHEQGQLQETLPWRVSTRPFGWRGAARQARDAA